MTDSSLTNLTNIMFPDDTNVCYEVGEEGNVQQQDILPSAVYSARNPADVTDSSLTNLTNIIFPDDTNVPGELSPQNKPTKSESVTTYKHNHSLYKNSLIIKACRRQSRYGMFKELLGLYDLKY